MKYTNADLTRWLQAANAALAENDLDCVVTSREGSGEIRTPEGSKVTVWASGRAESLGPSEPVEELLEALAFADLVDCETGKMVLKMPPLERVVDLVADATVAEHKRHVEAMRDHGLVALKVPTTDQEIADALRADTPLNKARHAFSSWSARIEQVGQQRTPLDPLEWRRMEFQAVAEIAAALGLS